MASKIIQIDGPVIVNENPDHVRTIVNGNPGIRLVTLTETVEGEFQGIDINPNHIVRVEHHAE